MKFEVFIFALLCFFKSSDAIATMAIDVGTEFIKVAIVRPGVPMEIALNGESQRKTPTIVAMRKGERTFGDPAMAVAVKFPQNAFMAIPRIVGKNLKNPVVQDYMKQYPYHKITEEAGQLVFENDAKQKYTSEELLAMILENAKEIATASAEYPVKDAVITTPPYFSQVERRAVMRAAEMAGINVLQLMNDNAAVSLQYGIFRRKAFNGTAQYYMFYDLGSRSAVATVVSYQVVPMRESGMMEKHPQASVLGVGFDQNLGAADYIMRLREHLVKKFIEAKLSKKDIRTDNRALAKLYKEATRVFRVLSANKEAFAQVETLFDDKDFKTKVTREILDEITKDLTARVGRPVEQALARSNMHIDLMKEVILMGGGTRIPKVQEAIIAATGRQELGKSINTDEAAALGAVYQAAYHSPGFRVMRFAVKDATMFPITVDFQRAAPATGSEAEKTADKADQTIVRRVLFGVMNPFPQKKVLTFNKHYSDFSFGVNYGDLAHLTDFDREVLAAQNISKIKLKGLSTAQEKHKSSLDAKDMEPKGVKAHFRMDDSGILHLDTAEAHFEKQAAAVEKEKAEEGGAFSKIGASISNLFGGSEDKDGKKDEKAAGDAKDEKKTEKDTKDEKKEEKKSDSAAGDKPAENKTAPAKPVLVKEPIIIKVKILDMPQPDEKTLEASKQKIVELKRVDLEKKYLEKSRNELEGHIFEMKDKLEREEYTKCSTEEERAKLAKALQETNDWYDEQGDATLRVEFETKLSGLRASGAALEKRVKELVERPKAFETLKQMLNHTRYFMKTLQNLTGEGKVFTQIEVDTLSTLLNETEVWDKNKRAEALNMNLRKEPEFLAKDVLDKASNLDREMHYLITKAKYWVPPVPATPPPTENSTANSSSTPSPDAKKDEAKSETKKEETIETKDEKKAEETKETGKPAEAGATAADEKKKASSKAADEL